MKKCNRIGNKETMMEEVRPPNRYDVHQDGKTGDRMVFSEAPAPDNPRKRRSNPLYDNLTDYTANTTLHGFRYFMDPRLTAFERTWWVIWVACSIAVCVIFIRKVWIKWDETPVIVSFAETSNSVWHVPFPAVTICTETKPKQRTFNFTKAFLDRWKPDSNIPHEDLQKYYDMLLLCDNSKSDGPDFANTNSIQTLQELAPTLGEVFHECLWTGSSCQEMFSSTLTKDGYCFTFNMLANEDMFRTDNLHTDYLHVAGHNRSDEWSLGRGYAPDTGVDTYPRRGPSYGGVEFEVIMMTDTRDLDQICRGPVQGFKVWLHNPAELPNMGQNFFRLPIQQQSAAAILPRVMDTSEGLRHYPPHRRQCYFPEERYLRFFRTYTQRNCELECASNYTASSCGCVPLYMPHDKNTRVCGGGKRNCIMNALEFTLPESLSLSKSSLVKSSTANISKTCDCLQACTELSYDLEVTQAVYDLTTFRRNPNPDIASGKKLPSGLVIYFSAELFTSLRRSELYGQTDFLANCGGIMGLFMGFSFLSIVEIVYYFTLRLWCRIRRGS